MDSLQFKSNIGCYSCSECKDSCYDYDSTVQLQDKLDSLMPWIGMYIAAASTVCYLAMAADAFHGFRSKMLWFPCKYFSSNSMSLTLLAVALKLPVDLTANMLGNHEMIAWVCSLVFMSTATENFMTSLGSMDDNEMLLNPAALGIMVVVVIFVNVCVHLNQMSYFLDVFATLGEEIGATAIMFLSLVILCSLALTVLTTSSYIECKYQEMHKIALDEEKVDGPKFAVEKLRLVVKKYWVMAVTVEQN